MMEKWDNGMMEKWDIGNNGIVECGNNLFIISLRPLRPQR